MSQKDKKIIVEVINLIESSIREGLVEAAFIKIFREKVENYLEEKLTWKLH